MYVCLGSILNRIIFHLVILSSDSVWPCLDLEFYNKKHLKNVGPIRHCEPPHAHSPDVASGTVARRLRINVHDDNAWQGTAMDPWNGPNKYHRSKFLFSQEQNAADWFTS